MHFKKVQGFGDAKATLQQETNPPHLWCCVDVDLQGFRHIAYSAYGVKAPPTRTAGQLPTDIESTPTTAAQPFTYQPEPTRELAAAPRDEMCQQWNVL